MGEQFGKYFLERKIAVGGMAEIFLATQAGPEGFEKKVAIKRILPHLTEDQDFVTMFLDEARLVARFTHPNIVQIFELGQVDENFFVAMEFVHGLSASKLLKECARKKMKLPLEYGAKIVSFACEGLDYAHAFTDADGTQLNLIHRDISPQNLMLSYDGVVKVLDFGIAKAARNIYHTRSSTLKGKAAYMSPEQITLKAGLDKRSDIFSLGIVLFELFSGHHPFEAKSEALITNRILRGDPDPPSRHGAGVPPELATLILRMVAKDPMQRPGAAREVADALREMSRKAVARSAGTDPTFTGLDDLERQLVENLVTWARQRESEGALEDALAAYEKAARLAPDSERIKRKIPELADRAGKQRELEAEIRELERHLDSDRLAQARESLRKAWVLGPHDPRLAPLESRIAHLEAVTPEARERKEFVAPRMKEVDSALDEGKIDDSLALLSQILRKYPDQADAAVLLDRLVEVTTGGIAYGDYRAAVRNAGAALRAGHPEAASASRERAKAIWPDGPEAQALESEISAAKNEARLRDEEREAARLREEKDRVRRQYEILERYMDGARDLLTDARAIEPFSPGESRRAIEAFGKAVRALDLVLTDRPDHPGARALRQQVLAEIAAREKALAEPEPLPEPPPPQLEPEPRPLVRRVLIIVAGVLIGAILIGFGAFAVRKTIPHPLAKELEQVLRLSENSETEVEDKMKRIRAIDDLLPRDDERKVELARQEERLVNLHEMYVLVKRLENLRSDASTPTAGPGEAEKLRSVLEYLSGTFDGYRSKLASDDPTAISLAKKERSIISEIEERTAAH